MAIKRLGAVSAYAIAVEHGYTGTEAEWLASLKGERGERGETGEKGDSYIITEADKTEIADEVESKYTTELGEIKQDLIELNDSGRLTIYGNLHHYYLDRTNVIVANKMDTMVFRIENGKTYDISIVGNIKTIGFSNVELDGNGSVAVYKTLDNYDYTFTNTDNYAYLYVNYLNRNSMETGNVSLYEHGNIATKTGDIATIERRFASVFNTVVEPKEVLNGRYINAQGAFINGGGSEKVYVYPLQKGGTVEINGLTTGGARCVYTYNSETVAIRDVSPTHSYDPFSMTYTATDNDAYIAFGVTNGVEHSFETVDYYTGLTNELKSHEIYDSSIGNLIDPAIVVETGAFTDGKYLGADGVTGYDGSDYSISNYIPVLECKTIIGTYIFNAAGCTVHFYDANKQHISAMLGTSGKENVSVEIHIPYGTSFIRYTVLKYRKNSTTITYKDTQIPKWYRADSIVTNWFNTAHGKIENLFAKATEKPIITIIDDDTLTMNALELYRNSCIENGVKGNYAVLTNNVYGHDDMISRLKAYEREGFQCVLHCHTQGEFYNTSSASYNFASAQNDFVQAIHEMNDIGFANWKYWCTPYGAINADFVKLAKTYGMDAIILSGMDGYESTLPHNYGRYGLYRMSLNQNDTALNDIKNVIDRAKNENGWVIITTHMAEDGWSGSVSQARFAEMINYAKNKGFEFCSVGEAFARRKPIYDLYEMF